MRVFRQFRAFGFNRGCSGAIAYRTRLFTRATADVSIQRVSRAESLFDARFASSRLFQRTCDTFACTHTRARIGFCASVRAYVRGRKASRHIFAHAHARRDVRTALHLCCISPFLRFCASAVASGGLGMRETSRFLRFRSKAALGNRRFSRTGAAGRRGECVALVCVCAFRRSLRKVFGVGRKFFQARNCVRCNFSVFVFFFNVFSCIFSDRVTNGVDTLKVVWGYGGKVSKVGLSLRTITQVIINILRVKICLIANANVILFDLANDKFLSFFVIVYVWRIIMGEFKYRKLYEKFVID